MLYFLLWCEGRGRPDPGTSAVWAPAQQAVFEKKLPLKMHDPACRNEEPYAFVPEDGRVRLMTGAASDGIRITELKRLKFAGEKAMESTFYYSIREVNCDKI